MDNRATYSYLEINLSPYYQYLANYKTLSFLDPTDTSNNEFTFI